MDSSTFNPPNYQKPMNERGSRMERMGEGAPLFVDVTWHEASDPGAADKATSSSSIAAAALNFCGLETVLHMTCALENPASVTRHLRTAQRLGLRNLLALRGDVDDEQTYRQQSQLFYLIHL